MKRLFFVLLLAILGACGEEESPRIKGCMDVLSLNYNEEANEDDGSCIFPADKLVGSWNLTEEVKYFNGSTFVTTTYPTGTFSASVTKTEKSEIKINLERETTPVYIYIGVLKILWEEKKIEVSGTSVKGTITDENKFDLSYTYGTASGVYTIKQTYTR